jgi:sarcosine oxidase delta subunit
VIHDHKIAINFCPYCGEKLNEALEIQQTDFHKQLAPKPAYPEPSPENFFQCLEVEAHNTGTNEKWFIIRDPEGIWMLEKYTSATKEMVESREAEYVGELQFLSGSDILYCPFCGELLDTERASKSQN